MEVLCVPCLGDNYGWLVRCAETGATASIDTPDGATLLNAAKTKGWAISHIFNTHHHMDHVGGNEEIARAGNVKIFGAAHDAARIPGITDPVTEGDVVSVGNLRARILDTPGHTTGHICYLFEEQDAVFAGDTLFSLGCGRMFEGNAPMMSRSMDKLKALPPQTALYCAHEYTLNNARFAVHVDPDNAALAKRVQQAKQQVDAGHATVPSTIAVELETNPFLRANDPTIRKRLGLESAADHEVFGQLRKMKDSF